MKKKKLDGYKEFLENELNEMHGAVVEIAFDYQNGELCSREFFSLMKKAKARIEEIEKSIRVCDSGKGSK